MSSKLGISAGTHSLDRVSNFDIEEKPVKFFYSPNNNIQNYSVFPDDDIESLRNHFHIQIKEMISKQDFSNLPEIYEKLNQISLKSNLRNFVPSPKSLLFLLNVLRLKKINDLDIMENFVWNLSPTDTDLVSLKFRLLKIIGMLKSEQSQKMELNRWMSDLVGDL